MRVWAQQKTHPKEGNPYLDKCTYYALIWIWDVRAEKQPIPITLNEFEICSIIWTNDIIRVKLYVQLKIRVLNVLFKGKKYRKCRASYRIRDHRTIPSWIEFNETVQIGFPEVWERGNHKKNYITSVAA